MASQHVKKIFLLDTCAWIWITQGNSRITPSIQKKLIESDWIISAISVWEVVMLELKKRIELNISVERWIEEALITVPKLTLVNISPEIAIKSCKLEGYKYADPADRIIIATALHQKAVMVTGDKKILEYCHSGNLPVVPI